VPSLPSVKGRLDARYSSGKCSRQGDRKWNVGVLSTEFLLSESKTTLIEFSGRRTCRIPTEFYPVVPTGGVALFLKETLESYLHGFLSCRFWISNEWFNWQISAQAIR
jgi:hypothetical protein